MKKKSIKILAIIVFVAAIVLYNFSDFINLSYLFQAKLPKQYEKYQLLNDASSANYQMKKLGDSWTTNYVNFYDSIHNTLTLYTSTELVDSNDDEIGQSIDAYYKLDSIGNLIDSFKTQTFSSSFEGYFVNENHYNSWMLNGDTVEHLFTVINKNSSLDTSALRKEFLELYQQSKFVYYINSDDYDTAINEVLFLKDNKWLALFGKGINYNNNSYPYGHQYPEKGSENIDLISDPINPNPFPNAISVRLVFFYKTHFRKERGPSLGSETGSSSPSGWYGDTYINLVFRKDTLKIKEKNMFDADDSPRTLLPLENLRMCNQGEIVYYANEKLHFALFSDNLVNNGVHGMFIIKPKLK
jgi:hypothetical protein